MCEGPPVWRQQQCQGPAAVTLGGRPCPHPGSSGPSPASPACGWPARGGQGTSTTLSLAVHSVTRPVLTLGTVSNPRLLEEVLFVYVLKYRIFLIQGKASGCHLKTHFYSCLSVYLARAMCRWPAGRGGPGGLRVPSAGPQPQGAGAPTRLLWSSGAWPSPRANSLCPLQFQTQLEKLLLNLFLSISLK